MNADKLVNQDLGFRDDAITILMNLVHIEVHSARSYANTENEKFKIILEEARKDRTMLLDILHPEDNQLGESWCIIKHSLVVMGGFIELAVRAIQLGKREMYEDYFKKVKKWEDVVIYFLDLKGGEE